MFDVVPDFGLIITVTGALAVALVVGWRLVGRIRKR